MVVYKKVFKDALDGMVLAIKTAKIQITFNV